MFQSLLRDVSMQVAACPNVEYVTTDEIPNEIREREKAIEMGRDDLEGKPEQMKEKIVEGRIGKRLKELALMEQPFIKDSSITVADLVKQTAGKIGENVKVRRFTRYTLGEGIEVEENDFAAEVASMQNAEGVPKPKRDGRAWSETCPHKFMFNSALLAVILGLILSILTIIK